MEKDAEEYGDLHNKDCATNWGESCGCENLSLAKAIARDAMESVNKYWVDMCEAHRKHCTPEGRKDLTRLQGEKNRSTPPKQN